MNCQKLVCQNKAHNIEHVPKPVIIQAKTDMVLERSIDKVTDAITNLMGK